MAESVTTSRYYCHQCAEEIIPNEDFTCPSCNSGFIEEVNERFEEEQFNDSVANSMNSVLSRIVPLLARNRDSFDARDSDEEGRAPYMLRSRAASFPLHVDATGPAPGTSNGRNTTLDGQGSQYDQLMNGPAGLDTLVQQLITSLIGNAGIGTHGFLPGDYVIGQSAFDNIVTQLMNQLEPAGPAPATPEQIKALEVTVVTQEQIDDNLQCSVCFDEYKPSEKVNKLPCCHVFHLQCIKPWLERHGTCPICRKTLSGEDTSTLTDNVRPTDSFNHGSHSRMPRH